MLNCSAVACIVKGHLQRVVTLTFSFPHWSQFSMLFTVRDGIAIIPPVSRLITTSKTGKHNM